MRPKHKSMTVRAAAAMLLAGVLLAGVMPPDAAAQGLRFSNHREVKIPDYATVRIGPFYSSVLFQQTVGYRYVRTTGAEVDTLDGNQKGEIRKDGDEFPMVSALYFRNYLAITRRMDLDLSVGMAYEYYPLDSQENQFVVSLPAEGVFGNLSSAFVLTPVLKGTLYDNIVYRTDYVDTRGIDDRYGGSEYEYFANTFGVNMDWLVAPNKNIGLSLSRHDAIPQGNGFEGQERVSYREGVSYEHEVFPGFITGVGASFSQTDFAAPDRADTTQEDYSFYLSFARGEHLRLTEASSLKLSVGFSRGQTKQVRTADLPAVAPDSAADPAAEGVSGDTRRAEAESEPESVSGSVALTTQLRRDLAHKIGFSRGIRGGFSSAFETYDRYSYHLRWGGDATTAEAYTEYTDVENSDLDSDYTSWVSGLILSYPLVENIRLRLSTAYNIRENSGDVLEDADPQDVNNYETWTTRLSSSFELTKKIDFTTYFQHVERTSDDDQLAYKRDIVAANLRFSHQF